MSKKKDWTIMVYMSGDNNLSVDMTHALKEIKNVAKDSNKEVNLFVYYDGSSQAVPTLYCDFTDFDNPVYKPSYLIENKLYDVEKAVNEDNASKYSILNFVNWCINKDIGERLEAKNYGLIFSGHSFGFQSIGLLKDEFSGDSMSMEEMKWFLGRITKSKEELESNEQVIVGKKMGILGFDSCVMSMLEVGNQFIPFADTMIASEGSVPSAGWAYAEILGRLAHSSKHSKTNEVATQFVKDFIETEDSYTLSSSSVDMAAWDLNKLEGLNDPFARLSQNLLDCFEDKNSTIYKQMKRVLSHIHRNCQTYMLRQNVDLGDFCELLKEEISSIKEELNIDLHNQLDSTLKVLTHRKDLNRVLDNQLDTISEVLSVKEKLNGDLYVHFNLIIEACDDVLEQLQECVLLSGFSGGKYQFSNGISLFFPWSKSAYLVSSEDYQNLHFVKDTVAGKSWNQFLIKYLGEVTYRNGKNPEIDKLTYYSCAWLKTKQNDEAKTNYDNKHKMQNTGNPKDKMQNTGSPIDKMQNTGNPADKMQNTGNPIDKMQNTGSPIDKMQNTGNPADKMLNNAAGGSGNYLGLFKHYDNIEIPWEISGFTKKQEKASPESAD